MPVSVIIQWLVEKALSYLTDDLGTKVVIICLHAVVAGVKFIEAKWPSKLGDEAVARLAAVVDDIVAKLESK